MLLKNLFLTDFITSLLPDMEATLWIGLRWTAYERINKWTDNRELTYSNFHPLLVSRRLRIPENVSFFKSVLFTPLWNTWVFHTFKWSDQGNYHIPHFKDLSFLCKDNIQNFLLYLSWNIHYTVLCRDHTLMIKEFGVTVKGPSSGVRLPGFEFQCSHLLCLWKFT